MSQTKILPLELPEINSDESEFENLASIQLPLPYTNDATALSQKVNYHALGGRRRSSNVTELFLNPQSIKFPLDSTFREVI